MRKRGEIAAPIEEPKDDQTLKVPTAALERFADLHEGESITITIGAETYSPVKYRNFEIGPFSGTVIVRPGETGAIAAMRLYRVLLELNEAEFQIAWGRHKARLEKTGTRD